MYKVEYNENIKDTTYDDAYYSSIDNNNKKWENYYTYLKEKNDLCYNVSSITIDIIDIEKMKFECFSNGILLKLYLMCKKTNALEKYEQVTILNNNRYNEELIYNIFKTDWLIDERLLNDNISELERRKNYYQVMIDASEERQDIKIQFRNKLFEHFINTYDSLKEKGIPIPLGAKVLKLENRN